MKLLQGIEKLCINQICYIAITIVGCRADNYGHCLYFNQYNNEPKDQLPVIIIFDQRNNVFTYLQIFGLQHLLVPS